MNNFVDLIMKYAKMMNYGMSLSERNQKDTEEEIEWCEAKDLNIKSKLEEEGSDRIITVVLRMLASDIDVMKALENKIMNDLKKKNMPECCFNCERPTCDEDGILISNGGTRFEQVYKCPHLEEWEENNG